MLKRLYGCFLVIFLGVLMMPQVALATSVEEADELARVISEKLEGYFGANAALIISGEVEVVEASYGYHVTLPNIALIDPSGNSEGQFVVGHIQAQMARRDDGAWNVRLHIPAHMEGVYDGANYRLDIGGQDFRGVWRADTQFFMNYSNVLRDIIFYDEHNNREVRLGALKIFFDMLPVSEEVFGIAVEYRIEDFQYRAEEADVESLNIAEMSFIAHTEDIDSVAYQEFQQNSLEMQRLYQENFNLHYLQNETAGFFDIFDTFGGLDYEFRLEDLDFTWGPIIPMTGHLNEFHLAGAFYDMGDDLFGTYFSMGHNGFEMLPSAAFGGSLIENFSFEVKLEEISELEFRDFMTDNIYEYIVKELVENPLTSADLWEFLVQQGGTLQTEIRSATDRENVYFDADIQFVEDAIYGVEGMSYLEFSGVDKRETALPVPSEGMGSAQNSRYVFSVIETLGRQSVNNEGETSWRYLFEFMDNGQVVLNDQDISDLVRELEW